MSTPDLAGRRSALALAPEALATGAVFPAGRGGRGRLLDALEAGSASRRAWASALLLLAAAFLARAPLLGNPVIHVDEQFYLLVGDRMLHGALPFVDVWDRKPVGLFLLYAAIRLLGGEGVLQYQVVATLFAAATAFTVSRICARFARPAAGVLAGAAYLLWLGVFGGEGGQAPVFYNLPVALAGLLALRAVAAPGGASRLLPLGAGAMLLAGLAMQIKYTAVFEGVFLGCALLWAAWRAGVGATRLAGLAAAWVALALLPTAAALLFYVAVGHGEAFVFANFTSIFQRSTALAGSPLGRFALMAALLSPLLACALLGRWPRRAAGVASRPSGARAHDFVVAWAAAALAGVLVFGTYYDHYALPLLVPLAAAAAPFLGDPAASGWRAGPPLPSRGGGRRLPFRVLVPLFAAVASTIIITKHVGLRGDGEAVRAMADFLRPRLRDCLFVHEGDPILYHLTGSCLPTRYSFPSHLNDVKEAGAIGVDQEDEMRRILATRPTFIVSTGVSRPRYGAETWTIATDELNRNYERVLVVRVGKRLRYVFQRRPGA